MSPSRPESTVPMLDRASGRLRPALWVVGLSYIVACGPGPGNVSGPIQSGPVTCSIPEDMIFSGGVDRDGIPALSDPEMVRVGEPGADYLSPDERVIGVLVDGVPVAVPHRVLWVHEIANITVGSMDIAVTYCPLTGSSLVFDRSVVGGAEFGVSGLLYLNNLIMYDRRSGESFWPQMSRGARCGPSTGLSLPMLSASEMTWAAWSSRHPDTLLPKQAPEAGLNFGGYRYPYGDYEEIDNPGLFIPLATIDSRRPPKERVLGVPTAGGGGGMAFPFGEFEEAGAVAVARGTVGGRAIAVFWSDENRGATAFVPRIDGQALTFEVAQGEITDRETGSRWSDAGLAVQGELEGAQLDVVTEAYVAFWFAWSAFHPETGVWEAGA